MKRDEPLRLAVLCALPVVVLSLVVTLRFSPRGTFSPINGVWQPVVFLAM